MLVKLEVPTNVSHNVSLKLAQGFTLKLTHRFTITEYFFKRTHKQHIFISFTAFVSTIGSTDTFSDGLRHVVLGGNDISEAG